MFYSFLIIILSLLIVWNSYALYTGSLIAIVSILIQSILLVLVIIKHEKTKLGINIWTIWMMFGASLSIFGKLLKLLIGDEVGLMFEGVLEKIILLVLAYIIYSYNKSSVFVELVETAKNKELN